jgi:hypothetical protein
VGPLGLGDAHLVSAALFALQTEAAPAALLTMLVVLERYCVPNAEQTLRPLFARWNERGIVSRSASGRH